MKNRAVSIVSAIALIGLAVGVVRPRSAQFATDTWKPVLDEMVRVPVRSEEFVQLSGPVEYVVFMEEAGARSGSDPGRHGVTVGLVEERSRKALPMNRNGASYDYELDSRAGTGLAKISVTQPAGFELDVSGGEPGESFAIAIAPAATVDSAATRESAWILGGYAVTVLLVIAGLNMLRRPAF